MGRIVVVNILLTSLITTKSSYKKYRKLVSRSRPDKKQQNNNNGPQLPEKMDGDLKNGIRDARSLKFEAQLH